MKALIIPIFLFTLIAVKAEEEEEPEKTAPLSENIISLSADKTYKKTQLRNPFWPVNFIPSIETNVTAEIQPIPQVTSQPSKIQPGIKVTETTSPSIPSSTEPPPWPKLKLEAIITGTGNKKMAKVSPIGIVTEGEEISAQLGNWIYTWKVVEISNDTVKIDKIKVTSKDEFKNISKPQTGGNTR